MSQVLSMGAFIGRHLQWAFNVFKIKTQTLNIGQRTPNDMVPVHFSSLITLPPPTSHFDAAILVLFQFFKWTLLYLQYYFLICRLLYLLLPSETFLPHAIILLADSYSFFITQLRNRSLRKIFPEPIC